MVKKDQLCAIALMKIEWIVKASLRMVALETNHTLLSVL